MPDLEKTLRDLAQRGEITHLSICAVAGKGPGGVSFSASYTPASVDGTGFGRSDDPVAAIEMALSDDRLRKLLSKKPPKATSVPVTKAAEPASEDEPWMT